MKPIQFILIFAFLSVGILLIGLIIAAPTFHTSETISYFQEGQSPVFSYNLSSNVTNGTAGEVWAFSINGINSSLYPGQSISFYSWIAINSSTGVLTINSTKDNQTGRFNISVQVIDQSQQGSIRNFFFIANATNDAPSFSGISSVYNLTYNLSQAVNFVDYINATDEEAHYPLFFSINFTNCSLANWSIRSNCTLLNFLNVSNVSVLMNYTPTRDDVGVYYANISVRDYGQNYSCSSGYCASNYSQNLTAFYNSLVTFNVFTTLGVNASNCMNKVFQENVSNTCQINVTTSGQNDIINISSSAYLRNYQVNISNSSWFYSINLTNSTNFERIIYINTTPQKTEIGNWTINFTIVDLTFNQSVTTVIYVYVNRTNNNIPRLVNFSNLSVSIDILTRINLTLYDDDFLIPDKGEGYNETINFTVRIFNQSYLSQELNISNFQVQTLYMPVSGTNRSEAKIEFTPNSSEAGNYTINISINDKNGALDSEIFNLTIFGNNYPRWLEPLQRVFISYESNQTYFNLSQNATDADGTSLAFSYTNDTSFKSFNMSSLGIVNFTSSEEDVGQHIVNATISDGFLINSTLLNFTIYNVNEAPYIEEPLTAYNASVGANSSISCVEDNRTTIILWVQDNDFNIIQKNFYNETLTFNISINGSNSNLLNFTKNTAFPYGDNRSQYQAIFTPNKSDVGVHNITILIIDNGGLNDSISFNISITELNHNPSLSSLENQTSAINRTLYYRVNATDVEDGNSWQSANTNLSFNYSFLNGSDFINNNQSIFNFTSGILNISFNSSHPGIYRINITVNDSTNRKDSKDFWIYVYDAPVINYPSVSEQFSLAENTTQNLTFLLNHSVGDNLTYELYMQNSANISILRYNLSFYGNNSNLTWSFTPNFTDETSGAMNITLVAYPKNTALASRTSLNITRNWNITINHTNFPLSFSGTIGGSSASINGSSPQTITLSDYFSDLDASDSKHNQTIGFVPNLFYTSSGSITVSVTNWTNKTTPLISFSASSNSMANYSITAYEYNESNLSQAIRNISSNNFSVEISSTSATTTTIISGGGGAGRKIPVAFKIIGPPTISGYANRKIIIPFSIVNKGDETFEGISLNALSFKNGNYFLKAETSLDKDYISKLAPLQTENLTLTVFFDKNESGDYEILLNATSKSPVYNDWAKIYINIRETNDSEKAKELILFTEELIAENPECIEINEILYEAKKYFERKDFSNAILKAEEAISACKKSISQISLASFKPDIKLLLNQYLIIATLFSIFIGVFYYFIKRRGLNRLYIDISNEQKDSVS